MAHQHSTCFKIHDRRQIKYTSNTQTKYNPEKSNNVNTTKQNYPSSVLLHTPPENEVGIFYNASSPHRSPQPCTSQFKIFESDPHLYLDDNC